MYSGALPVVSHGGRVTLASTPAGERGMFYRLVLGDDLAGRYSQHRIPWWLAPWFATNAPENIEDVETDERVARHGTEVLHRIRGAMDKEAFQQEYELRFQDENDAFVSMAALEACAQDIPLAQTWAELASDAAPLYAGMDIGRTHHATEIVVVAVQGNTFTVRAIRTMAKTQFDAQEVAAAGVVETAGARRLLLDRTGIGANMSENLMRRFPGKVEGIAFGASNKDEMAQRVKRLVENGQLILPRRRDLLQQMHAVRRLWSPSGRALYAAPSEDGHHADQFWALALALHAAETLPPSIQARSVW